MQQPQPSLFREGGIIIQPAEQKPKKKKTSQVLFTKMEQVFVFNSRFIDS